MRPIGGENGFHDGAVATISDITEARQQEETLREARATFQFAFDNAPIGIGLADLDRRWTRVNAAFCDILGYPPERFTAMTVSDVSHPDDVDVPAGARRPSSPSSAATTCWTGRRHWPAWAAGRSSLR